MRRFLFLFLFLVMSCGGGGQESARIVLRMTSSLAPFYTKVSIRISGKEFEPIWQSKEGIFYPGDRVSFEVNMPEGKERLIEAVIYDPEGKPLYYASKTLDLSKDSTVIMDMKPSQKKVNSYQVFSDGKKPIGNAVFYLFSEDLYSINASFSTSQNADAYPYMVGSYMAYYDGKAWRFLYLPEPSDADILLYERYTLPAQLPEGIESMKVYGSYEGILTSRDNSLSLLSERMLSDGTAILTGFSDGIYYSVSKGSISFKRACQEEGECRSLNVDITGEEPDTYTLFASYGGIRFPVAYGELFIYKPYLTYYLYTAGMVKEPCVMRYSIFTELKDFTGSAHVNIKLRTVSFEGIKPNATLRLYSTDGNFEMEGHCESSSKGILKIPYWDSLYAESIYPDGKVVGVFLRPEDNSLTFPDVDLEVSAYELKDNYLLLEFKRGTTLAWCSLKLFSEGFELTVDKIPPWRSYLKFKRLENFFDKLPDYTLRCYSEDGKYYVELSSAPKKVLY
ncbi:hypothetical protein [Hydrogenobacter thermophilus]|uniref:hypothetical protein n=1 Tax=Hydrogenobacter thermophilus TaxID=940 RepID=UPI0026EB992A|nr:hypothetical protein [Hydrogenobacter thermophilus]